MESEPERVEILSLDFLDNSRGTIVRGLFWNSESLEIDSLEDFLPRVARRIR